jgi:hypothetical protein
MDALALIALLTLRMPLRTDPTGFLPPLRQFSGAGVAS